MANQVATLNTLTNNLANSLNIGTSEGLIDTLKRTAFKGDVSDEQMVALLIVANQYKLNPWTMEIYAFPSNGGITPVVGVDGWARIINSNPQFDGMSFEQDAEKCTCRIHRKDRSLPVEVTEWMDECKRSTKPWQSHPKRMLRHKAMIQAARLAFGFSGIFDEDEAERIRNAHDNVAEGQVNPFTGDTTNKRRDEILSQATDIANDGDVNALYDFYRSLSKEDREIVGTEEFARLKKVCENTVNAEVSPA